jgi:hypothetical protein
VADHEGLAEDWLNDAVKGFLPGPDPDAPRFYSSDSLIVDVATGPSPWVILGQGLTVPRGLTTSLEGSHCSFSELR